MNYAARLGKELVSGVLSSRGGIGFAIDKAIVQFGRAVALKERAMRVLRCPHPPLAKTATGPLDVLLDAGCDFAMIDRHDGLFDHLQIDCPRSRSAWSG